MAGNLACRTDSLTGVYPGMTVYTIGDTSHQAEPSDHNPDARSIVHALDAMTYTDTGRGRDIVAWALYDPTDLEYVIFDRTIYSRQTGFRAEPYYGSNPHTDHVHLSGKHGTTGYTPATGTGYDTTAEAYRPAGIEDYMAPTAQENASVLLGTLLGRSGPTVGVALQSTYNMVAAMNDLNATMQTADRTNRRMVVVLLVLTVVVFAFGIGLLARAA